MGEDAAICCQWRWTDGEGVKTLVGEGAGVGEGLGVASVHLPTTDLGLPLDTRPGRRCLHHAWRKRSERCVAVKSIFYMACPDTMKKIIS